MLDTQGNVPYYTLSQLEAMSPEQISKMGEATFDNVVQLTIIREKIYQEAGLISVADDIVVTRPMAQVETEIFAPIQGAVQTTYPVPPEGIGETSRTEPVAYNVQKINLQMAETRFFISDDARLRGASDWLEQDSMRRAAESLAAARDNHVLNQINTETLSSNNVAATGKWNTNTATPEDDVAQVISNIIANSNIPASQINKPAAFALVIPAAAFVGVTKLKLIRNIIQPVQDYLQTEYKVKIFLTRKPLNYTSWPVSTSAFILPLQDISIGFLGTFDGAGIIPAQLTLRMARGVDVITRQWFSYGILPEPLDGTTTTNARIGQITGIL